MQESAFGSIILQKSQNVMRLILRWPQEQLKPPNGGVFLGLNGIVIKSHGGSDAEGFADVINIG
jgi:fatty acid/phospholipid biosynthesis enzyme